MNEQENITPPSIEDEQPKSVLDQNLPEGFVNELSADWNVDPSLESSRQLIRVINKAEDYLAGITPEGVDKNRARIEAGRMLVYVRSMVEAGDLVPDEQRERLQQEVDRVWNEGGKEANNGWIEQHKTNESKGIPQSSESQPSPENMSSAERMLGTLEHRVNGIPQMFDSSIKAIDQAINFISTNEPGSSRISGLELSKKILNRKINPGENIPGLLGAIAQARETFKNSSLDQSDKEAERQLLSKIRGGYGKIIGAFIEVANSLQSIARNTEPGPNKTVVEAAQRDMDDVMRVLGGVNKINAVPGGKVDFETMEPIDIVESQDPSHSSGDVIAEVTENGYQFDGDLCLFDGKGADVIHRPKVEVFKSKKI